MGIREKLNKNPVLTTASTIAVIVIVLIFIILQLRPHHQLKVVAENYYTDDDGKTFFAADAHNIPPFTDANGKEAVRAYVFKCGKEPFVGYEEKFDDWVIKAFHDSVTPPIPPAAGKLIKRPGDPDWVLASSREGAQIVNHIESPDGSDEPPILVKP